MKILKLSTPMLTCAGLLFGSALATAEEGNGLGRSVDKALQVELTGEGLNLIGGMVKDQLPGELNDVPLPDATQSLPGGFEVKVSGMKASLALDSLSLAPAANTLQIKVGLKRIKVSIDRIDVTKEILGFPISANCRYTDFNIAEQGVVFLKLDLQPTVVDTNIQLAAGATEFKVSSDNYRVDGPGECHGTLILDGVLRRVLHGVFSMVRPLLGTLVSSKVKEFLPKIADELNAQTHLSAEIDLSGIPPLPERTAEISAFPSAITIDGTSLKAEVGVKIRQVSRRRDVPEPMPFFGEGRIRYGAIGVNPSILTAAFAELYEGGTEYLEVDENTIPQIKDLLTKEGLSSIWPDLLQQQTDAPYLRLQLRLAETPVVAADQELQAITVHLPKVQLKFQVQLEGEWKDYFIMDLNLKTGASAKIVEDKLQVSLIEHNEVTVEGRWADGYTPIDPTFEKDTATAVFAALLEIASTQGPLVNMDIPSFPLGGREIYLARPHVEAPYFRIDLTGN